MLDFPVAIDWIKPKLQLELFDDRIQCVVSVGWVGSLFKTYIEMFDVLVLEWMDDT